MPKIEAATIAEHREMRRRQLLDAAAEILVNQGSAALTPSSLAKRSGISRTSVYHYYASRSELLLGTVAHLMETAVAELDRAVAESGGDPMDQIEAYVTTALGTALDGVCAGFLDPEELPEDHRGDITRWHERLLAPLCRIAEQCRAEDAALAARLIQGMIDAAARAVIDGRASRAEAERTTLVLLRAAFGADHGHGHAPEAGRGAAGDVGGCPVAHRERG